MAVGNLSHAKVYVTTTRESTFGSKTDGDAPIMVVMGAGYNHFVPVVEQVPNGGMTIGKEIADKNLLHRYLYRGQLVWDLVHPNDLAWALTFILGDGTSNDIPASTNHASGVYDHVFEADDAHLALPSFTLEEVIDASNQYVYTGCLASDLSISKSVGQPVTMTMGVIAKERATGSDSGSIVSEPAWLAYGTKVYISTATDVEGYGSGSFVPSISEDEFGSGTEITNLVRSFNIAITNISGTENLYAIGDKTISRNERTLRTFTISLTMESEASTYLEYSLGTNGIITPYALEFQWDSGVLAEYGDWVEAGDYANQCSNWVINGSTASNTNAGVLYWKLTDSAGTHTVSVYKDSGMASGALVASGTGRDGSITLSEQNSSGLSGSVTVAYKSNDTIGNTLTGTALNYGAQIFFPRLCFDGTPTFSRDQATGKLLTTHNMVVMCDTVSLAPLGPIQAVVYNKVASYGGEVA